MAEPRIQTTFTITPQIYEWLSTRAVKNKRSRNAEITAIVEKARETEEQSNA